MSVQHPIFFQDGQTDWAQLVQPQIVKSLQALAQPASILAWRSHSLRSNFFWLAQAEAAGLPALPLRFELERELGVLGDWQWVQEIDDQVWVVSASQLAPALQNCAYLNLSSGTSASRTIAFPGWGHLRSNAIACAEFFRWDSSDLYWCTFPFYAHAHELFSKPRYLGAPILALQATEIETINQHLQDPDIRLHILTTPHIASAFLARHLAPRHPHQVCFELAGEYVAIGVVNRLRDQGFRTCISWGSAETTGVAIAVMEPRVAGCIGTPLPGYQLGTLTFQQEMNLHLEGEAIPPFLANDGQLRETLGRFTAKDLVVWDGNQLMFRGRSDRFLKFHGTYIDVALVEGWAKQVESVDNAFLALVEHAAQTQLVLFVQCVESKEWDGIRHHLAHEMLNQYGGIRLAVQIAPQLAHTPTGKLIRDPHLQLKHLES
ncbi:MAG: hypothetical protein H6510_01050 [Acidobacteria bacterium]|nr:hypothetical protein [Acidobacteriota bacterium]MCB9396376.1 hypothetical protein [Acidobacteriota bacterium]